MVPEDFNTRALEPGASLWHYTDFSGLQGILAGKIWASSLSYMNDTQEFSHGLQLALKMLQPELALAFGPDHGAYSSSLYEQVVEFFSKNDKPRDVFIAAFSTEADDLSQWRAYGGTGPSFSIGFNPMKLEQKASQALFDLDEVQYTAANILAELKLALREPINEIAAELAEPKHREILPQRITKWAARLVSEMWVLIPRYKNPKFSEEKEWRLIRRQALIGPKPSFELQFRRSASLIVPYIEMPLHASITEEEVFKTGELVDSPLAEIIIGPSPHPEELFHAVSEMTARKGIVVNLQNSEVPFRNW